ncbi:MAG: 23S rRNA (adenine(1618)-N(6))-methyltransferase RlmF [Rikenellaceae bacterium]
MIRESKSKGELHPRNRHRGSYDFAALVAAYPPLEKFVEPNKYGTLSINFFEPSAVKALNRALLALHYKVEWWELPSSALIPPIPGRADYIHYLADLVGRRGDVRCLDVGIGANCIYPIIGCAEYGWEFVGCDIDSDSLRSAQCIVERNQFLSSKVELREQKDRNNIFEGVIKPGEYFDLTLCNPPFHDSAESAAKGTQRKLRGLKAPQKGILNFAGRSCELWCKGGEKRFIKLMISQSRTFATQCGWFTTLVSNEDNLKTLLPALRDAKVMEHRVIEMHQGNKRNRILAWKY